MLSLVAYGAVAVGSLLVAYLIGVMNGAPFVATSRAMTEEMLDGAQLSPGDRFVDLGSGDGRLVIAAGTRGISAVGYEINPLLVWVARRAAQRAGVAQLATFRWQDFWAADLSSYSVVIVFGVRRIMPRLEKKLERELAPGSRVVCNLYPIPGWSGRKGDGYYVYER